MEEFAEGIRRVLVFGVYAYIAFFWGGGGFYFNWLGAPGNFIVNLFFGLLWLFGCLVASYIAHIIINWIFQKPPPQI